MQIEVTTRLTTCCYYRFEGGDRGGSFGFCRRIAGYRRFAAGWTLMYPTLFKSSPMP